MTGEHFVFSMPATEPAADLHIQSGCTPGDEPASITLKPNGDILVNGRKAANDQEVVDGLRELLMRMWRTDTCFVPSVSDDMKIKRCEFGVRHGGKHSWEYPPTDKESTDGGATAPTEPAPPSSVDPCRSRVVLTPGDSVRIARELQEMTQERLAAMSGVSRFEIAGVERGKLSLSVEMTEKLARVLKVHPSVLLWPNWDVESK